MGLFGCMRATPLVVDPITTNPASQRVDLGEVDASALVGALSGYVVDAPLEARAALEPLMAAFDFAAAERDFGARRAGLMFVHQAVQGGQGPLGAAALVLRTRQLGLAAFELEPGVHVTGESMALRLKLRTK